MNNTIIHTHGENDGKRKRKKPMTMRSPNEDHSARPDLEVYCIGIAACISNREFGRKAMVYGICGHGNNFIQLQITIAVFQFELFLKFRTTTTEEDMMLKSVY